MDVNLKDDYRHDQCLINQSRSDFTLPYETGTGCQGQRLAHFNPSRLSPSRDRTFVRYGPSVIKLTFSIGNMLSILFFSFFLVLNTYKVDRQNLFYFISCFFFSPLLCSLLFIFFLFCIREERQLSFGSETVSHFVLSAPIPRRLVGEPPHPKAAYILLPVQLCVCLVYFVLLAQPHSPIGKLFFWFLILLKKTPFLRCRKREFIFLFFERETRIWQIPIWAEFERKKNFTKPVQIVIRRDMTVSSRPRMFLENKSCSQGNIRKLIK